MASERANALIGSIIRALVGVSENHLGLVKDIVNRFGAGQADGDAWHKHIVSVLQAGLPVNFTTFLEAVTSATVPARTTSFSVAAELSIGDHDGLKITYWATTSRIGLATRLKNLLPNPSLWYTSLPKICWTPRLSLNSAVRSMWRWLFLNSALCS